ncbi:hypothetical protein CRG98_039841 [Punica granatum]|uniref:Retrotransposon gag domain-containing protein n=1 Tax=Punica granatum TaxID=22663 RepID=A0A2I0I8V0_PUNGR|nr:hypothetical protein CRG98_039841 [Punica granatum]
MVDSRRGRRSKENHRNQVQPWGQGPGDLPRQATLVLDHGGEVAHSHPASPHRQESNLVPFPPSAVQVPVQIFMEEVQKIVAKQVAKTMQKTERQKMGLTLLEDECSSFAPHMLQATVPRRESLRDYYDRFLKMVAEIDDLSERERMATFQRGLKNEDLMKSLLVTPPTGFDDMTT